MQNQDKHLKLKEQYPLLFNDDPMEPVVMFGIETGLGWDHIISSVCKVLYSRYHSKKRQLEYALDRLKNDDIPDPEEIKDWQKHAEKLHAEVQEEIQKMPKIQQIKEKFGGLRIYCSENSDYVEAVISMAEEIADNTCEECGNKGKLYELSWFKTLCPTHAKARYGDKLERLERK